MTTSEWLLYNILDLKFVQGKRVREVSDRLAMSESDLYRKQRVAITEVARALAEMEASAPIEDSAAPEAVADPRRSGDTVTALGPPPAGNGHT